MRDHPEEYILENTNLAGITFLDILKHSSDAIENYKRGFVDIQPRHIEIDCGLFTNTTNIDFPDVTVTQLSNAIVLSCPCKTPKKKLCNHQAIVLCNLLDRPYLRIFFDSTYRQAQFKQFAIDYGMENEPDLDAYFEVEYAHNACKIRPKIKELLPLNEASTLQLQEQLLPKRSVPIVQDSDTTKTILVFRKHKYYSDQFHIELYECNLTANGKPKPPFTLLDPQYLIWNTENVAEVKFYIAISKFQQTEGARNAEANIEVLKVIAKNPRKLEVFLHNAKGTAPITANTLVPVLLQTGDVEVKLAVDQKEPFYEVSGELLVDDKPHPLKSLDVKFDYFVQFGKTLHLIANANILRVIGFFKKHNQKLLVHPSKFELFRNDILTKLEHHISIQYSYIKPATKKQIQELEFDQSKEKIIYLSDGHNYVYITPVVKYGKVEIPVFSKKQIYDTDPNGNEFKVERDNELEVRFTSVLLRQHPDFEEQLHEGEFYLHKTKFLNENWFLSTFEEWRNDGITILGFNELSKNKLNMYKGNVAIQVSSDIDWFNAKLKVQFGNQQASLKQLHRSIKNKTKFVQLDDGTVGILPDEWMEKFANYFQSGEVVDDSIVIPKSKFVEINELFGQEVLEKEARNELALYLDKFSNFENIQEVAVPQELKATLRDYQKQGLNWLNFLDDFNFGACLADDMGLGKTIQIIALILSQRAKRQHNTNLVIVPTSLLFNWETEVAKFAPSIKMFTNYGPNKIKNPEEFAQYEIILTTYGMLQADISLLKHYCFNYIVLDESQAIKNPESQRYKLVRMLRSRNKVVLTGTPFENNTYDIYGQLSFACPGLLGSKQYFKNIYSNPIDRFSDGSRANKLQKIIHPFILRRTKKQVAKELPEKTEMVLYCEMGVEQRQIYTAAEQEIRDMIHAKKDDDIKKETMYVLKGLMKLRQICNSPNLLGDGGYEGDVSSKIEVLMEQITEKAPHHKILVFSQFVSMLDLIRKELEVRGIPFAYLTGKVRNRASKVNAFQNDDTVRVFLISLKAGGTGLNLTEADYVYLVDPWWNPAVENQAIDRCYRIGQKKNVVAIKLICPGTIEEKIMKLQAAKTRLSNELIKTDVSILKSLSKQDLLEMLK